jgi:class 3 adenylate cyclase/tetratricopeptide (TPR) repeat protein
MRQPGSRPPWDADDDLAAQRRQITVMFCDIVDSTGLSSRLDPEDLHDLIGAYQRCCADRIQRTGGFVAKYLGDGVLAYYGYPQAHENDPERAIRAALSILDAVPKLTTPHDQPIAARIGIATGVVVVGELVGEGWSQERAVVGGAPNLAARLQTLARPDQVVVSGLTHRLAGERFRYRSLDISAAKGVDAQESAWEVLGLKSDAPHTDDTRPGLPMIGREQELRCVLDHWSRCESGHGKIVEISGEPGIGKSRFIRELRKRLAATPHAWIQAECAQLFQNTPFYALSRAISHRLESRDGDQNRAAALERVLVEDGMATGDVLPLMAEIAHVPTPEMLAPVSFAAGERRNRLIAALLDWLKHTTQLRPTVFVVEDLQWADPSTAETLLRLAERLENYPLLLLCTARAGHAFAWPVAHTTIALGRLNTEEMRALIGSVAEQPPSERLLQTVMERADGVPYFAEELVRFLAGRDESCTNHVPATLNDLLMTRLDRLGAAKKIAQIASVLGREFPVDLLAAVSGMEDSTLRIGLSYLARNGIAGPVDSDPAGRYVFAHALIKDAAYNALLKRQRRAIHRRVARAIVERFPDIATYEPERVAQHWTEAGDARRAIAAWQFAGDTASARHALREAQSAYEKALALLLAQPDGSERRRLEFALQTALYATLQITAGYAAPATMAAMERARELAGSEGGLESQMRTVGQEWRAASSAGQCNAARAMADRILALAQADGRSKTLANAFMVQMTSRYRVGDIIGAEDSFLNAEPHFSDEFWRQPGSAGQTLGNAAQVAWQRSDPAEALKRISHGLEIGAGTGVPYDLAFMTSMASVLAVLMANVDEANRFARQSLDLCEYHGFAQIEAMPRMVIGRVCAMTGRSGEAIAVMAEGLQALARTASRVARTLYLTWLAEAHLCDGAPERALQTIEEALCVNPEERFYRPESLRVRGEIRSALRQRDDAAGDFRAAMALAKQMGAKRFFADAAASLNRMSSAQVGSSQS